MLALYRTSIHSSPFKDSAGQARDPLIYLNPATLISTKTEKEIDKGLHA